jgi:hypothetical protein
MVISTALKADTCSLHTLLLGSTSTLNPPDTKASSIRPLIPAFLSRQCCMRFVLADAYTATDELTGESQLNLLGDAAGTAFGVALETNASLTHLDLTGAPWCHAAWQCQQAVCNVLEGRCDRRSETKRCSTRPLCYQVLWVADCGGCRQPNRACGGRGAWARSADEQHAQGAHHRR